MPQIQKSQRSLSIVVTDNLERKRNLLCGDLETVQVIVKGKNVPYLSVREIEERLTPISETLRFPFYPRWSPVFYEKGEEDRSHLRGENTEKIWSEDIEEKIHR